MMFAIVRPYRRHLRASAMLTLLILMVFLAGGATHAVERGETLSDIAQDHGVSVSDLVAENSIRNPNLILVGQVLQIPGTSDASEAPTNPTSDLTHTVVPGESLSRIAWSYGVSTANLVAINSIKNPNLIWPGQTLDIPSAGTAVDSPLYHVVQRGESLSSIANRYDIS